MPAVHPIVISEAHGLRMMHFGNGWCQGAMRLKAPDRLELAYAVRMFAWLLFHDIDRLASAHLLTLGLGAGSLTRFAHRVLGLQTTAVEIDAGVIAACRSHFGLPPDDERLRVVHGGGAEFMAAQDRAPSGFDIIQVDAYDAAVRQPALDSDGFYADCRASLRAGGTVAVNLVGACVDVRASVGRLRRQLHPVAVWQFPPTAAGNVVVVAHCGAVPTEAQLTARAAVLERRWDLPAGDWLRMARRTPAEGTPLRRNDGNPPV